MGDVEKVKNNKNNYKKENKLINKRIIKKEEMILIFSRKAIKFSKR